MVRGQGWSSLVTQTLPHSNKKAFFEAIADARWLFTGITSLPFLSVYDKRMPKKKKLDGRQKVMRDFALAAAERGQYFFYVLIREPLAPLDRGNKYEDPLAEALGEVGEVVAAAPNSAQAIRLSIAALM